MRLCRNIIQALATTAALVGGAFGAEPETQNADLSFAFDYFRRSVESLEPTTNFVFSPISAERIVGSVALGAKNQTKSELISALRRDESDDVWLEQTSKLYKTLRDAPETTTFGGLWIQEEVVRPRTDFLSRLVNASLVDNISFEDFSSSGARERIDRIIAEKTKNRIPEFFSEEDFRIDGRLILADVVLFDGEWAKPFDPELTSERDFVDANGVKTLVPQMRATGRWLYAETKDGQYVELPYRDARFSFAAFLPNADAKYVDFESALTAEKFNAARKEVEEKEIELFVPKFSVTTRLELSTTLKKLGVVEAFGDAARFEDVDEDSEFKLDEIRQGVSFVVDEQGTKASATTTATFVPKSLPMTTCDLSRPFVYAIRENSSGALLFLGRLVSVEGNDKADSTTETTDENAK